MSRFWTFLLVAIGTMVGTMYWLYDGDLIEAFAPAFRWLQ